MTERKRVLIVEDDRKLLDLLREKFETLGLSVDTAVSIRGGLAHVASKGLPDLIVSDLNFLPFEEPESFRNRPRELGFELHRMLLEQFVDQENPMPPFILHTGDDRDATILRAEEAGMVYRRKGYSLGPTLSEIAVQLLSEGSVAQR